MPTELLFILVAVSLCVTKAIAIKINNLPLEGGR